ncbi:MAG TPA: SDR family NAD(P)-dependent oxidoreductase, partial [Acidobacteriota bacterium]|nr:SDR family NAD(P)-dependent oxidoreductase [Acidobacteriota bacterium]
MSQKVAIVTGSTKGIGRAVAEYLLNDGYAVVISARNLAEVDTTVAEFSQVPGRQVSGTSCDMRDYTQVESLVQHAIETFGRLDVLVNNAGVGRFATVEAMSPDIWREVIETNLNGVFYACHAAIPHLRASGGGYIFN